MRTLDLSEGEWTKNIGDESCQYVYAVSGRLLDNEDDVLYIVHACTAKAAKQIFAETIHQNRGIDVQEFYDDGLMGPGFKVTNIVLIGSKW